MIETTSKNITIPTILLAVIEYHAKQNNRSLSEQVCYLVEQSLVEQNLLEVGYLETINSVKEIQKSKTGKRFKIWGQIKDQVKDLPIIDKYIVQRYYRDSVSLRQISKEINISHTWLGILLKRVKIKLKIDEI